MDRKPGRPRALTVDVIAAAALEDGIATFSMPSVARRLGVAHSGLYRYVTDRDDLLVQTLDRAFLGTTWPSGDLPWADLADDELKDRGVFVGLGVRECHNPDVEIAVNVARHQHFCLKKAEVKGVELLELKPGKTGCLHLAKIGVFNDRKCHKPIVT